MIIITNNDDTQILSRSIVLVWGMTIGEGRHRQSCRWFLVSAGLYLIDYGPLFRTRAAGILGVVYPFPLPLLFPAKQRNSESNRSNLRSGPDDLQTIWVKCMYRSFVSCFIVLAFKCLPSNSFRSLFRMLWESLQIN